LTFCLLIATLPFDPMQNQVTQLVGSIKTRAVTQALVGTERDDWPVREVDTERIDLLDADTEANDDNAASFK